QVPERDPRQLVVLDEGVRHSGEQHLPAVAGRRDPGGSHDADAVIAGGGSTRFAGMDAHADAHDRVARPWLRSEETLGVRGRLDCVACARESEEEGVALVVDLFASMKPDGVPDQAVVDREQLRIRVAELPYEPRRALDVREQERDGSERLHAAERTAIRRRLSDWA